MRYRFVLIPLLFSLCSCFAPNKEMYVRLFIDNEFVEKKLIGSTTRLVDLDYLDNDGVHGCNEWYLDELMNQKVDSKTKMIDGMNMYGVKNTILEYRIVKESFAITGVNFIPSTGSIIIPKAYEDAKLYSVNHGTFEGECKGLRTIYIPKCISHFNGGDMFFNVTCIDLKEVHFEGTKEEWDAVNGSSFPSYVDFIFNSYN